MRTGFAALDADRAGSTRRRADGYAVAIDMTRDAERAYVKRWVETGQLLEEIRWRELRVLDNAQALRASSSLIAAALHVPLPLRRRQWSGLIDQQDLFHPRRS